MSARILHLTWLAIGSLAATAHAAGDAGALQAFAAQDSEGFSARRLTLGYLPAYTHRDAHTGIRVSATHFSQDAWSEDTQQLTVVHRDLDPATTDGLQIEAGLARQGGHSLLSVDAGYRRALGTGTSVEAFVNRDWVETRSALAGGVKFTFAGAALEQAVGRHLTVVGVAGYQDFSDGNYRKHARAKLIVQPLLDLGLTLQLRYRVFKGAEDGVRRSYFNPGRYDESMLAVGYRKRVSNWVGNLTAGVGRQRVGDAPKTNTRLLEAGLESPQFGAQSVRVRAGYNRSASFGGPDYSYRYAQAEWHVRF